MLLSDYCVRIVNQNHVRYKQYLGCVNTNRKKHGYRKTNGLDGREAGENS